MTAKTRHLRELIASGDFLYMPSAATPLEGRLAEAIGTPLVYTGGYVTGASRMITEPLLTMDEQVRVAGEVARAVAVPLVADAGAGFGEPLHTMRTVREFAAAEVGADLGLVFPRNHEEAAAAPRLAAVPLVWVQSRGNRDGRPILSLGELKAMGYRACIDAQILLGVAMHFMKGALREIVTSGRYTGIGDAEFTALRQEIEDLIGLDAYYRIESETVEAGEGTTPG